MKMLRRQLVALASLALLGLAGCGPHWVIVSQAVPNVLAGQRQFAVMPIDFTGVKVGEKDEAVYLSGKDPGQQQSWQLDKEKVNATFAATLMAEGAGHGLQIGLANGPGAAPFIIRPHAVMIEPGFYVGVASGPGRVRLEVQIITSDGRPVDVIVLEPGAQAYAVTQRLVASARISGFTVARYLELRSAGGA